jgi:hypothetical protein
MAQVVECLPRKRKAECKTQCREDLWQVAQAGVAVSLNFSLRGEKQVRWGQMQITLSQSIDVGHRCSKPNDSGKGSSCQQHWLGKKWLKINSEIGNVCKRVRGAHLHEVTHLLLQMSQDALRCALVPVHLHAQWPSTSTPWGVHVLEDIWINLFKVVLFVLPKPGNLVYIKRMEKTTWR